MPLLLLNQVCQSTEGYIGGADLCFLRPLPDTSLHCETTDMGLVYRTVLSIYSTTFAGTHCAYPQRDGQAELAGYIPRWFTRRQTVTHPSTNRARCRVTSLIMTNVLNHYATTTTAMATKKHHTVVVSQKQLWYN